MQRSEAYTPDGVERGATRNKRNIATEMIEQRLSKESRTDKFIGPVKESNQCDDNPRLGQLINWSQTRSRQTGSSETRNSEYFTHNEARDVLKRTEVPFRKRKSKHHDERSNEEPMNLMTNAVAAGPQSQSLKRSRPSQLCISPNGKATARHTKSNTSDRSGLPTIDLEAGFPGTRELVGGRRNDGSTAIPHDVPGRRRGSGHEPPSRSIRTISDDNDTQSPKEIFRSPFGQAKDGRRASRRANMQAESQVVPMESRGTREESSPDILDGPSVIDARRSKPPQAQAGVRSHGHPISRSRSEISSRALQISSQGGK